MTPRSGPHNVFRMELRSALGNRRRFVMRIGLSFLLGMPFVLVDMPPAVRASGLAMLTVFVAFIGSAVARTRHRSEGRLEQLALMPGSRALVLADFVISGAVVDVLQLAPVFALFVALGGGDSRALTALVVAGLLVAVVIMLNLLGTLLGSVVRSNAEVHLAGALGAGVLALLARIVPSPGPLEPALDAWGTVCVLGRLRAALLRALTGPFDVDGPTAAACGAVLALGAMVVVGRSVDFALLAARGGAAETSASVDTRTDSL